jgi:hypothetical protein
LQRRAQARRIGKTKSISNLTRGAGNQTRAKARAGVPSPAEKTKQNSLMLPMTEEYNKEGKPNYAAAWQKFASAPNAEPENCSSRRRKAGNGIKVIATRDRRRAISLRASPTTATVHSQRAKRSSKMTIFPTLTFAGSTLNTALLSLLGIRRGPESDFRGT